MDVETGEREPESSSYGRAVKMGRKARVRRIVSGGKQRSFIVVVVGVLRAFVWEGLFVLGEVKKSVGKIAIRFGLWNMKIMEKIIFIRLLICTFSRFSL